MALIGADVHANGKHGWLIPRFGTADGFVFSYGKDGSTGCRCGAGPSVPAATANGGRAAPGSLLGEGPQTAERAVLRDPDGTG
ncbi:hypothetical protein P3T26_003263 [Streptomyces sp. MAA16]|nr:hypothetical protein [Streptomyces sp. MAA16]